MSDTRSCAVTSVGCVLSTLMVVYTATWMCCRIAKSTRKFHSQFPASARTHEPREKRRFPANVKAAGKEETGFLEMEVLVGAAGNSVFLDWLEYIKKEIASRPYHSPDSFWYIAKMRYVYHTTGPLSMQRFLRLSAKTQGMTFISSSWFKQTKNIRLKESAAFEVLSFESNSYFTKEHEIKVPVGLGDTPLMLEPVMKRMRCKCTSRRFGAKPAPRSRAKSMRPLAWAARVKQKRLQEISRCILQDHLETLKSGSSPAASQWST